MESGFYGEYRFGVQAPAPVRVELNNGTFFSSTAFELTLSNIRRATLTGEAKLSAYHAYGWSSGLRKYWFKGALDFEATEGDAPELVIRQGRFSRPQKVRVFDWKPLNKCQWKHGIGNDECKEFYGKYVTVTLDPTEFRDRNPEYFFNRSKDGYYLEADCLPLKSSWPSSNEAESYCHSSENAHRLTFIPPLR